MFQSLFHEPWQRKTARFLFGQTLSLFGSNVVQFAIIWHITLTTGSGTMMTLVTLFSFIPQILISFIAGVWADRYSRRLLIIASDAMTALSTLLLALAFLNGYQELWLIMAVSGIRSLGAGIQTPAVSALLPQIVPLDRLTRINGINGSLMALVMLAAPAVSGAMMSLMPLGTIFMVDVVTAALAIGIMLGLQVGLHDKAMSQQTSSHLEDFLEGLRYVASHPLIRSLLFFYALFMFMIVPAAFLTPLFVARRFGEEVWRLTASEVAFSAGGILGGALMAVWGGFRNKAHTLAVSSVAFGVLTAALGVAPTFLLYLVIMVVTGVFMPFFNTASTVMLQEKVDADMQGRVFSFVMIVSSAALPAGMVLFGPVADRVPLELLLVGTGAVLTLQGISIFYNHNFIHWETVGSAERAPDASDAREPR